MPRIEPRTPIHENLHSCHVWDLHNQFLRMFRKRRCLPALASPNQSSPLYIRSFNWLLYAFISSHPPFGHGPTTPNISINKLTSLTLTIKLSVFPPKSLNLEKLRPKTKSGWRRRSGISCKQIRPIQIMEQIGAFTEPMKHVTFFCSRRFKHIIVA